MTYDIVLFIEFLSDNGMYTVWTQDLVLGATWQPDIVSHFRRGFSNGQFIFVFA